MCHHMHLICNIKVGLKNIIPILCKELFKQFLTLHMSNVYGWIHYTSIVWTHMKQTSMKFNFLLHGLISQKSCWSHFIILYDQYFFQIMMAHAGHSFLQPQSIFHQCQSLMTQTALSLTPILRVVYKAYLYGSILT